MVYTVTMNPSIDYTVNLKSVETGCTNRSDFEEYRIGGKGINVSLVLSALGVKSTALGFAAGFTGETIVKELNATDVKTDFVTVEDGISRINIKIKADKETEINCHGPKISDKELELLLSKFDKLEDGDTLVLSGSVPQNVPDNIYETVLKRVSGKNILTVVDSSKKLLISSLKYKPFLIKPNKQELSEIFSARIIVEGDIIKYAGRLRKLGAANVLVSLGREGALLIDEFGIIRRSPAVKGRVVDTVGSGDSMVAGFIASCIKNPKNYELALKLGSACGNATAFSKGLASRDKINEILSLI